MTVEEFIEKKDLMLVHSRAECCKLIREAYNEGYETGKLNERAIQCGKNNQLKDVERLEKIRNELVEKYNRLVEKYNALADRYNKQGQVLKLELEENRALVIENEQLKKIAVVRRKENERF